MKVADDNAVSPEVALEIVGRMRKRGGFGRLVSTALTLPLTVVLGISAISAIGTGAAALAIAMLAGGALGCGAIATRNLIQNRVTDWEAIQRARRLPQPIDASIVDHVLVIGNFHAACQISLSPAEEAELRRLALPAARVR